MWGMDAVLSGTLLFDNSPVLAFFSLILINNEMGQTFILGLMSEHNHH